VESNGREDEVAVKDRVSIYHRVNKLENIGETGVPSEDEVIFATDGKLLDPKEDMQFRHRIELRFEIMVKSKT
jgi:hypothetical protein